MRKAVQQGAILLALLLIATWAVIPPAEKLRRGKDLAGGVSLVYAVDIDRGEDTAAVLSRTIEVLKDRVDPNGQFDITMVAQGDNRIEVSMPLPGENVRQLRREFEAQLADLAQNAITANDLESAVRLPENERPEALRRLARGDETRLESLQAAARAYDASRQARAAYEEAAASDAPDQVIDDLVEAAATAEIAYERARDSALSAAISVDEIRRALELNNRSRNISDSDSGELIHLPSPRERALEAIREQNPDPRFQERLDEVIAAYDRFASQRTGYDDPADLMRVLQGAGVLTFRIAPEPGELPNEGELRQQLRERGARNVQSQRARWYPLESLDSWFDSVAQLRALQADPGAYFTNRGVVVEERNGEYFMLLYDEPGLRLTKAEGNWSLTNASQVPDEFGRPAISFRMDATGARLLGRLTGDNVGRQMAILLDDQVYSAPVLRSRISGQGQISGGRSGFAPEEVQYLIRTLSAGSLAAKLGEEPISQSTLGPELGADNLRKGLVAGLWAILAVSSFMVVYYFTSGVIAVIALAANALLLLGAMSLSRAAFTMPGIAGVILTFGIAVDANVIIYERIREELLAGQKVKSAVRIGYQKALSAIVDGNVTNLIVCVVLGYTGTQEVRGFAITLGIGVVTTLISALLLTRVIFTLLLEGKVIKRLPMLPTAVPFVQRLLEPSVDWISKRFIFYTISALLLAFSITVMVIQGPKMFDNEFRGGTAVTINLDEGRTLARPEVEARLRAHAEQAPVGSAAAQLLNAEVVALNPEADQITSNTFRIKTVATQVDEVSTAVMRAFEDVLNARPPLRAESIRARAIIDPALGENIERPEVRNAVDDFIGGVAVVVENLETPVSAEELRTRIADMRRQPDHANTVGRSHDFVVIDGSPDAVRSFAILAFDPGVSYFDDEARWREILADSEIALVGDALERASSLAGVESFSPAIAQTFAAQAIVAVILSLLGILLYVWVRFGSLRYSMAAVLPCLHDAVVAVGFVAVAEIVYERAPGVASMLYIEPFKIDLAMVAAILTILGYSLNDTIVTMDRIRENRGKLPYATKDIINLSVNQTISRTVITGGTTLLSSLMLYAFGGQGIRGFAFVITIGVVVGTFSSIAVASPLVYSRRNVEKMLRKQAGSRKPEAEPAAALPT